MHAPQPAHLIERLRDAIPSGGLFANKEWRLTPTPFPLSRGEVDELEKLGQRLFLLQQAFEGIHRRSARGKLPPWMASVLDAGKPGNLIAHARSQALNGEIPRVIRPDLIATEGGFALTELDSVPGGIGLTAWMGETYAEIAGADIVGGASGMREGFRGILPGGADIVVSEEGADYRPEMEWLSARLNETAEDPAAADWSVHAAETYTPRGNSIYRFFELFDLPNIPPAHEMMRQVEAGELLLTPPMNPALEEKIWLALFWLRPLRDLWRRELRDAQFKRLQQIIPYSWVMDPTPLPYHGIIPRLDVGRLGEIADFSQKERNLVLKISGFSERAWGSRGVHIGADMPQDEWGSAVNEALDDFQTSPWLLQEYHKGKRVLHPFWDPEAGGLRELDGRVRLCPYYFNVAKPDGTLGNSVKLGGVLATIVPADKKILHGMSEAILAPCAIV